MNSSGSLPSFSQLQQPDHTSSITTEITNANTEQSSELSNTNTNNAAASVDNGNLLTRLKENLPSGY